MSEQEIEKMKPNQPQYLVLRCNPNDGQWSIVWHSAKFPDLEEIPITLQNLKSKSPDSFVMMNDVCELTGLRDSQVDILVRKGKFPSPVRLDGQRKHFVLGEVLGWMEKVKVENRMVIT